MIKILQEGTSKREDQIKRGNQHINIFEIFFWLFFQDLILENTNGNARKQNLSFHWMFLKIVSIRIKIIEKTSEMRVLLLEFLFKLWFEYITRFLFLETYVDEYWGNKSKVCWMYHFTKYIWKYYRYWIPHEFILVRKKRGESLTFAFLTQNST